jgi:hypothetical protein
LKKLLTRTSFPYHHHLHCYWKKLRPLLPHQPLLLQPTKILHSRIPQLPPPQRHHRLH